MKLDYGLVGAIGTVWGIVCCLIGLVVRDIQERAQNRVKWDHNDEKWDDHHEFTRDLGTSMKSLSDSINTLAQRVASLEAKK